MPQPGPEHEVLKKAVGEWTAELEMTPAPGMPPIKSTGTETIRMVGGLWIVTEFTGDMMGQPFEGHGLEVRIGGAK